MLKVMIVDDDPGTVKLLSILISQMGYDVVGAGSGGEALELFPVEKPDVVLLDYMMPYLNGIETLKELRSMAPPNSVRFFMLTAIVDPVIREQALLAGADEYLVKPLDFDQFEQKLKSIKELA